VAGQRSSSARRAGLTAALVVALPFALAIGLSLGLVGAGGAILAVPVLVYVVGEDVKQATTVSLVVVGATALVGAVDHARRGRLQIRIALAIGAGGAVGAVAGTALNRLASPESILFLCALVLLGAAYAMLVRGDEGGGDRTVQGRGVWLWGLPAGGAVGLLTGFFGVGGGFLIVPLLVLCFGLSVRTAVGTSLLVITFSSSTALAAHLASGSVDWVLAGMFAGAAIVGALVGSRLSERVPTRRLKESFALLALAVSGFLLAVNAVVLV
jgi:uncharacterized membrane protein YfcA